MAKGNCVFGPGSNKILKGLKSITGANDSLYNEYVSKVFDANGLKKEFKDWYKTTFGSELKISEVSEMALARIIVDYYNNTTARVEGNSRRIFDNDKVNKFGYSDFFTREQGKKHCATILVRQYITYQNQNKPIKGDISLKYKRALKHTWNEIIARKIADISGRSYTNVLEEINEWISQSNDENNKEKIDVAANLKKALGGENMDATAKNLYALWSEINSSEDSFNKFFAEILCDSRVNSVRQQLTSDTIEISENDVQEAQEQDETSTGDVEITDVDRDYFVTNANSHLGTVSKFTAHLGERIVNYFNTLPKLISLSESNGDFIVDTNNPYGIGETMDATQCANLLYGICYKFTSYSEMVKAIREVSRTIKGFESFSKLADDLDADLDFGTELRTIFAKTVIARMQVRIQNGDIEFKQSNEKVDRTTTLIYNAMNDIRSTMIMQNSPVYVARLQSEAEVAQDRLEKLRSKINADAKKGTQSEENNNEYEVLLNDAKAKIINGIRAYYPSFSEGELLAYIELNKGVNGEIDQVNNLKNLFGIITATIKEAENTTSKYNSQEQAKTNAIRHNASLDYKRLKKGEYVAFSEYKDIEAISKKDYLSAGASSTAINLARMLEPYCTPQLQLTSANVFGNNSSDVINNNYLTNLDKILKQTTRDEKGALRNPILEQWGKERLTKSCQFNASNILLEQYDENHKPINDAIFRMVGGQVRLTEKGPDLLRIALFDGASNMDKGNNATYSKMQEGGYLPSAFMSFFNYISDPYNEGKPNVTSYFCRTPSDAPKNFMITGSRVDTTGLITVDPNDEETGENIEEIVSTLLPKGVNEEEWNDKDIKAINETSSEYEETNAELVKGIIKGKSRLYLHKNGVKRNIKRIVQKENDKEITYGITKLVCGKVCFLISGKLYEKGSTQYLYDTKVRAYYTMEENNQLENIVRGIEDDYAQALINGDVTVRGKTYRRAYLAVDRNHPVFKQCKNAFRQEMINAAVAANHYFELDTNGWVGDGDANASGKVIKLKEEPGIQNDKGYRFYHLDEDGKVLSGDSEKGYKLGGAVFHSNRFTLSITTTDEDGEEHVTKKNYFDDLIVDGPTTKRSQISILYGGANNNNYLHVTRDEEGKIDGVYFTGEQSTAIDERIEQYLIDYVQQSVDNVMAKKEFITTNSKTQLDLQHITDFAVNYFLFYVNCDDLFEGDTKFYLDSQTILKRAKEIQGSGVPYGIADYLDQRVSAVPEDVPVGTSFLNTGEIEVNYKTEDGKWAVDEKGNKLTRKEKVRDIFKGTLLEGVTQRTGFYGITIKNTQMTNDVALKALVKQLTKKCGLTKDQAETILYGPWKEKEIVDEITGEKKTIKERKGGFQRTKVNDAQSYITLQEFVRRIAGRGQLKKYLPMLRKVIEYDKYVKALDEWNARKAQAEAEGKEFKEKKPKEVYLTAEDMTQFIQVQKNFYYDQYYDERYGIFVPRQIKNAEFVLVPCFIKGTELEKLYNLMIENGIDQVNTVETSKAANEELITLWDNEGKWVGEEEFAEKADTNKQIFSYKYLYTQQETPQHMNAENKAGIQIVKKMIDNITPANKVLWEKKQEYFRTFVQNIRDSYDDLMDELGVARDEDGFIILNSLGQIVSEDGTEINKEVFYSKFRQELMRLGVDDNIIDYVTLDANKNPIMPSCMNNVLTKLEAVAQSLFNNAITRQKLPGFHAAQVTNVGWHSIGDVVEKRMYDKDLEYHPIWYVNKDNPEEHISKRRYNELSKEEKKQYKEDGTAPYIEVMLPASVLGIDRKSKHYRNMSDAEIIRELEEKGLDKVIGYRIPTEGKQSVCVMKIAAFVDDALGSTIIVPNDWVSQTGSDFDIDSVYGINFETYKNKKGEIFKVEYKNKTEQFDKTDWYRYILDYATVKRPDNNIKGKLKKVVDEAKKIVEDDFADIRKQEEETRTKLLNSLTSDKEDERLNVPGWNPAIVKQLGISLTKAINHIISHNTGISANTGKALYVDWCRGILNHISSKIMNDARFASIKPYFEDYVEKLEEVINTFDNSKDVIATRIKEGKAEIFDKYYDIFAQAAKDGHLLSLEEYLELAKDKEKHPQLNSKRARNNNICQLMIDILSDPASLEENLSRSNFDDISDAKDKYMDKNIKAARENRSAYNVFDQIKYQEDATSGMDLKGISVSLDTFCSICNTVQPVLEKPIYVVYPSADYKVQTVADRFGIHAVTKKNFSIKHDTYGWTQDNRNTKGRLLTSYSSETTAYILDAIKEGAIPNVNVFTFDAFKTLLNVGIDYDVSVAFIMQPAIARIVKAEESHNSVYATTYGDPVKDAIRAIATELGIEFEKSDTTSSILLKINDDKKLKGVFNSLFQQGNEEITIGLGSTQTENLPIVAKLCQDRLLKEGEFKPGSLPVEEMRIKKLMFDLGVVLSFNKLHTTANELGNIARCCNPDKFGAKQTLFSTNEVFQTIRRSLVDKNGNARPAILTKDGMNILEAIYPGISEGTDDDPMSGAKALRARGEMRESAYPTLNAYLKYASSAAIIVNREMFPTQQTPFVKYVSGIAEVLTNPSGIIQEDLYNTMQRYVLSYLQKTVDTIEFPIDYTLDKGRLVANVYTGVAKDAKSARNKDVIINNERARIYGFSCEPSLRVRYTEEDDKKQLVTKWKYFTVKDVNNPTKEEVEEFAQLSPAQKVKFIQQNFRQRGIFDYLDASLYSGDNRGWRAGMQIIEFTEGSVNNNEMFRKFNEAFYSNNVLVQMATFDLIKYAVTVEGLNMSEKGISKIIANTPLKESFEIDSSGGLNGTGFVDLLKNAVGLINTNAVFAESSDNALYRNFLRANKEVKGLRTLYLNSSNVKTYGAIANTGRDQDGTIIFRYKSADISENDTDEVKAQKQAAVYAEFREKMIDAGIMNRNTPEGANPSSFNYNNYIRVSEGKSSRLYAIKELKDGVILYPLNNLEKNECSTWSAKESNNKYHAPKYYENIIDAYNNTNSAVVFGEVYDFYKDAVNKMRESGELDDYTYKKVVKENNSPAIPFNIYDEAKKSQGMRIALDEIEQYAKDKASNLSNVKNILYLHNVALSKFILSPGAANGTTQKIDIGNNQTMSVNIRKANLDTENETLFERDKKTKKFVLTDEQFEGHLVGVDPTLANAARTARKQGRTMRDIFVVSPHTEAESLFSATGDGAVVSLKFLKVERNHEEPRIGQTAAKTISRVEKLGFDGSSESVDANKVGIVRELASYANDKARELVNMFDSFIPDPSVPNARIGILSDIVQDAMLGKVEIPGWTREQIVNQYHKALCAVDAFINNFEHFSTLVIDDENAETKFYIDQIAKSVARVRRLPKQAAARRMTDEYLSKISTNPLIKDQTIKIMDGLYRTTGSMWKFFDLQETNNPLLQTIIRDVMGDLEAKNKVTRQRVYEFDDKVQAIINKAANHGITLRVEDLVDENGRWIQDYDGKLIDDYYAMRDDISNAINQYGLGSYEHLVAKNKLDVWKAKHLHQQVKQEYYRKKAEAERRMLENEESRPVYVEYMKLHYQELELLNYSTDEGLSPEDDKKLKEIKEKIWNLTNNSDFYRDAKGQYQARPRTIHEVENVDDFKLYNVRANQYIIGFLNVVKDLNEAYWKHDPAFGFEEQLKINLEIIRKAENRDDKGIKQTSQVALDADEVYQRALKWVRQNASFVIKESAEDTQAMSFGNKPTGLYHRIQQALNLLTKPKESKNKDVSYGKRPNLSKAYLEQENAYDQYRIPDARKLSRQQLLEIKNDLRRRRSIIGLPEGTDRILISAAKHDGVIYKKEFYDSMKPNGYSSEQYFEVVTEINNILEKYTDNDGSLHLERIPNNEQGLEELEILNDRYLQLRNLKKYEDSTNGKQIAKFIEEELEEGEVNKAAYRTAALTAQMEGTNSRYAQLMAGIINERNANGALVLDENGYPIPSKLLFSSLKPKNPDKWIDQDRTDAINLLNEVFDEEPTNYWYEAVKEAQEKAENDPTFDYSKWWRENHVYNPFTRKYDLLDCWKHQTVNVENVQRITEGKEQLAAEWVPKSNYKVKGPKDGMVIRSDGTPRYYEALDMRDPDYKDNQPIGVNYIKGSGYDVQHNNWSDYHTELRDYVMDVLNQTASTEKAQRYFAQGYLPRRAKNTDSKTKRVLKEAGKFIGATVGKNNGEHAYHEEIGYDKDYIPAPPMTQLLKNEESIEFDDSKPLKHQYPDTEDGRRAYNEDYHKWNTRRKEVIEHNRKINNSLLDKDYLSVIKEYLLKAGSYNAVLDNKNKLYSALSMIQQQKTYMLKHGLYGGLKVDSREGDKENPVYAASADKNLEEWYKNFMRRILFDQYKVSDGGLVTTMNRIQGFTSADYMMLNYRGGIANITVGEAGILSEAAAREYIHYKDWGFGKAEWIKGCMGMMAMAYSDKSVNKQDAICKYFNVVDYDELAGVDRDTDMEEYSRRVRNFMFHPQTIGEHFMQNGVLFGMLHSHKLVKTPDDPRRIGVAFMNEDEYVRVKEAEALMDYLTDKQRKEFQEFKYGNNEQGENKKKGVLQDIGKVAPYAWWQKDLLTDFVAKHLTKAERKEFGAKRKEFREKARKEFKEMPNLYDQLELGDNKRMAFVKGSQLAELSEQKVDDKLTKADILMGDFTVRVRKVNDKIHGVYNKIGKAYIEREWYGALVMQYHKHLPMGLLKRFRRRGYYNEARGTVEKGYFWSLMDFIALDIDTVKNDAGWTENNVTALKALKFHLTHCFNYLANVKSTWAILPDYEKANIARNLGDLVGTLSGVALVIALLAMGGGDDDDSILYNLCLYEADRLASETFLYNPIGLYTEGKTLMSTPIAAQSVITDGFNIVGNIAAWLFGSEHYSRYYQTGQFAGRDKLSVYVERRIPGWNGIRGILEIPHNNHYYKRGQRAVTIIPTKDIAELISGK